MSDNQKPEKIYLNGAFVREKVFRDGGSLLNVTLTEADINAAFAAHGSTDNRGQRVLRLVIGKRKAASDKGITHWVAVDTYKPTKQADAAPDDATQPPPY